MYQAQWNQEARQFCRQRCDITT